MNSIFEVYIPTIRDAEGLVNLQNVDWKNGVVVRTPNWLGDAVMCLPALYQLRRLMPDHATMEVVTQEKLQDFWQCVPWVDSVITFDGKRVGPEVKKELTDMGAGVALILPNSFGSAKDMRLPDVPIRLGRGGNFRSMLLTHRLPVFKREAGADTHHQVSEYFDLVECFGPIVRSAGFPKLRVDISLPYAMHQEMIDFLDTREAERPLMVLAPGAAFGPAKQWPVESYRDLALKWADDGGTVIVIGTQKEHPLGEVITTENPHAFNVCGLTSIKDLVALFNRADICVTNDSGPMHLAAACGAKGVAIFGSTTPVATGPLGGHWVIASKPLDCVPCLQRECSRNDDLRYGCLNRIAVDEVYEAVWDIVSTFITPKDKKMDSE